MGGLECTKRIRQFEREGSIVGHVPIIAVTANVSGSLDLGNTFEICILTAP